LYSYFEWEFNVCRVQELQLLEMEAWDLRVQLACGSGKNPPGRQ